MKQNLCFNVHCLHCGSSHPVWSGDCDVLRREKDLVQIMTLQKVPRREAIILWEQNHSPLRFYDITRKKTYAEVTVDNNSTTTQTQGSGRGVSRIPVSNSGNTRGGGTGRGRGSHSQSNTPSSRNSASSSSTFGNSQAQYSSSIYSSNRFAALQNETSENNQDKPVAMDSSTSSKKRTLSGSSTGSNPTSNPPPKASKNKLNRNLSRQKLLHGDVADKSVNDTTYFYGGKSPFSNFHFLKTGKLFVDPPNKFKPPEHLMSENQLVFESTEQLYQFRKAWFFGHMDQSMEIYKSKSPSQCKKLGKMFKARDEEWHEVAKAVMCECQYRKYTGSRELRKQLQEGTTKFVELTSKDPFWGSGSDYIEESKGENYMGRILQSLRLYLLGQAPDSDEFKADFDKIKKQIADNPSSLNVVQK